MHSLMQLIAPKAVQSLRRTIHIIWAAGMEVKMFIALFIIFLVIALLPFFVKPVEENIEFFLLVMGVIAALVAGTMTGDNLITIFEDKFLYIITAAVFIVSILFRVLENKVQTFIHLLLDHLPLKLICFLLIVGLGLLSSVITAIIASLLLTEIVSLLPIDRKNKIRICIIACFSIGMGAVLTPIGEPLATIVTSKLHQSFLYMFQLFGIEMIVGILLLGLLGMFFVNNNWRANFHENNEMIYIPEKEDGKTIVIRTLKIFMFVVALMLLGCGFKPIIDTYIIHWNNNLLYAGNTVSAILDNATLAAAEISPVMNVLQIKTVLISLLVSGGMMVTGNIPNIVTASKLKISMKEWALCGFPVGVVFLAGYYVSLFHAQIFGL